MDTKWRGAKGGKVGGGKGAGKAENSPATQARVGEQGWVRDGPKCVGRRVGEVPAAAPEEAHEVRSFSSILESSNL